MSEFETLADLFPADRQPTRELEPIQKVDRTDQIERDIEEFYETDSARRVLNETAEIVDGAGLSNRFRYVHATFGSGKSHLLKLIGVATGEMEGLQEYAYQLANSISGFKQFRDALAASHVDHLQPLFMNLLDRDHEAAKLPVMLYEELGRRRGYNTSRPWLLELCWRLDIEYELWEALQDHEYEGLHLADVVDRPASLRPWLTEAIPQLSGAEAAGLGTLADVEAEIEDAATAMEADAFGPDALVERLAETKRYLEQDGEVHQFLIGLDEIAIYVGDQPRRYEEVVETVTALIEGLNPPILGTGQWSMRNMQRRFIGEVDDDAWYAQEVKLEGADTETIVRKRWLQKSGAGGAYIESELLDGAPDIEPTLTEDAGHTGPEDPVEAYPFRDHDLRLLRATMQGLIKGDRETDREYIQGRALLVRVRSLFADHGWATHEPGAIIAWDELYDVIAADTALVPGWAADLIERVENTIEEPLATRTAKALFLLSQIDTVPRTAGNIARLLVEHVETDLAALKTAVSEQLQVLADRNLIREDADASPSTYTILSEQDIRFWQEVQEEATEMPPHQVQDNILQYLQEADPDRLTGPNSTTTGTFDTVEDVSYTVRYSIDQSIPDSVTDQYDTIVVRVLANGQSALREHRERWQAQNGGPGGREDVFVAIELTEAIRQQVRQLVGMQSVLETKADPRPEYRLQRQTLQGEVEDELRERLNNAQVYTPTREAAYGSYLSAFGEVMAEAVDEKFPDRKTIERSIQLDDLADMAEFFQGPGSWPLTDADADMLGVKTVPGTIENGWAMAFLDEFSDEDRVSGEQILETIEGRRGAFLGTPPEALHALLFVLVADDRIEIRRDGSRVTDLDTIARIITRRTKLEDAVIGFDPEPPPEGLDDLYEALRGEPPDTDDTTVLLEDLASWADRNGATIRTVVSRTNLVFESHITLEALEAALEPAFSGGELAADRLADPTVIEQANRYSTLAPLFAPSEETAEPIWERYTELYQLLKEHYPTATVTKQMQPYATGSQVPARSTVEDQLERAEDLRVDELRTLYCHLTDEEPTASELGALREALTDALSDTSLEGDIEAVEDHYEVVTLDIIRSVLEQAETASGPLSEATLADATLREQAETLANGRDLLETESDGESLYRQLAALETVLQEADERFVTPQIERAISGRMIPDVDRARQLISQGRALQDDDGGEDDGGTDEQDLWSQIAAHDAGTIVVIDPEGSR